MSVVGGSVFDRLCGLADALLPCERQRGLSLRGVGEAAGSCLVGPPRILHDTQLGVRSSRNPRGTLLKRLGEADVASSWRLLHLICPAGLADAA